DGQGRTVDFRNTVIIMTSNLGTEFVKRGGALGFVPSRDEEAIADHKRIEKAIRDTFRPEFINRIDEIIIFNPLSQEQVAQIVDLQMQQIAERLGEQGVVVELTQAARLWLAAEGFDPQYGARPLRRALQHYVESPLSVKLLKGAFKRGDIVEVDSDGEQIIFVKRDEGNYLIPTDADNPADADVDSTN
ncbi:MAG: AAA domain-containing protein, partial [Anaerolineae bacterium]